METGGPYGDTGPLSGNGLEDRGLEVRWCVSRTRFRVSTERVGKRERKSEETNVVTVNFFLLGGVAFKAMELLRRGVSCTHFLFCRVPRNLIWKRVFFF